MPDVVAHVFNSTLGGKQEDLCEFNVSLLYVVRSFSKEARTFPNERETIINSLTNTDVRVT